MARGREIARIRSRVRLEFGKRERRFAGELRLHVHAGRDIGPPRILRVELNSDTLRAGGPIDIRVTTTLDVTRVWSGNGRRKGELTASGRGVFVGDSILPHVGGLLSVKINIHIEAATADGKTTSSTFPFTTVKRR